MTFKSKILLWELKLRYVIKTLPFVWKVTLLIFLISFFISGIILLHKIDENFSVMVPDKGGTLTEGIIGTPRFVNPILSTSDPDRDLVSLIYSGLMRQSKDGLIPDLAEKYEISEDSLCYTFTLKPDLLWSNKTPLTSNDIIFTIEQIQKSATKSPKRAGWEGVLVEKIDDRTIRFCLEMPYAPFLENTTIGILPKHIWQDILPEQMPLSTFNIEATGSGPFKIKTINRNSSGIITSYTLVLNKYFSLSKPYLKKIVLKFYPSEQKLIEAYKKREIDSLSAISPQDILEIKKNDSFLKTYQLPRIFAVFFNQDNNSLFAREEVRKALNLSVNKKTIVRKVLQDFGIQIDTPIPPGSLGFLETESDYETFEKQLETAKNLLANNGWKLSGDEDDKEKIFERKTEKETLRLEFSLSTSNVPDLVHTAQLLKNMWEEIGAKVNIKIYEIGDLEQDVLRPRQYDALLFGEIMGKDPDAFAFWHSSQRNDPGLNIALYTNITVDKLLEEARTIFDIKKREKKYREFQEELLKDTPAIFLYSPYFIHLLPKPLSGLEQNSIAISSERFSQIYNWYLNTKKIWKIFLED